jgi:hypothetical protein
MIGVAEIYVCALALLGLVGLTTRALIYRGESLMRADILPLGLSVLVLVQYVTIYAVPVPVTTYVLIAVCVFILGWRVWRVRRKAPPVRALARGQSRLDAATLIVGVLLGFGALVPLFQLGFASTIAISIADGWAYAAEISWLRGHSLSDFIPTGTRYPLNNVLPSQLKGGLGIGFEMFGTAVLAITRRQPFEVINAVSATAFAIAAAGWRELWCAVRLEARGAASLPIAFAAVSPLMVLLYTENQVPNLLAMSLMPFVLASALRFGRAPTVQTLAVVSISAGATLGIYTPLAPWLLAGLVSGIAVGTLTTHDFSMQAGWVPHSKAAVLYVVELGVLLMLVAVAICAVAVLPVRQFVRTLGAGAATGVQAARISTPDRLALLTGSAVRGNFGLDVTFGNAVWSAYLAMGIVLVVCAVALVALLRSWRQPESVRLALIVAALVIATLATIGRFPGDGYAEWKALIVGGALAAGFLLLTLTTPPGLSWRSARIGVVVCIVIWLATSALLVERTLSEEGRDGPQGFRRPDVQLGDALSRLPKGSVTLVEGIVQDPPASQMRMMAAYFGTQAHLSLEGLGTTPSYVAGAPGQLGGPGYTSQPAGDRAWTPTQPWRWVLDSTPGIVTTRRPKIWANRVYRISAAPILDVTPFGVGWSSHPGWASAFVGASGELLVSNRSAQPRLAVLSMDLVSSGTSRDLQIFQAGADTRVRLPARARRTVRISLNVGAYSVLPVTLTTRSFGSPQPVPPIRVSNVSIHPG